LRSAFIFILSPSWLTQRPMRWIGFCSVGQSSGLADLHRIFAVLHAKLSLLLPVTAPTFFTADSGPYELKIRLLGSHCCAAFIYQARTFTALYAEGRQLLLERQWRCIWNGALHDHMSKRFFLVAPPSVFFMEIGA
jgi:hypothetical protein